LAINLPFIEDGRLLARKIEFYNLRDMLGYECGLDTRCVFRDRIYKFDGDVWKYK